MNSPFEALALTTGTDSWPHGTDTDNNLGPSLPLLFKMHCIWSVEFKQNYYKKLSYRRGTARRATLVSSHYVSRIMGVTKVLIRKSDLQGHSSALALVPFDKPHTISY